VRVRLALLVAGASLARPEESRAADPFEECSAAIGTAPEAYDSWFCFYRAAERSGNWGGGEAALRAASAGHEANGWVELTLGHFARRRSEVEEALWLYGKSASRFQSVGHFEGEVSARTNLRALLGLYGRAEEAKGELLRIVAVAEASSDPLLLAQAYQLQAHHLIETGEDIARAHRLLKRAEALLPEDGPYRIRRNVVLGLGNASFELGRYEEALEHYRELDRISENEGNTYTRATAQYNLANTRLTQLEVLPSPGGLEEVAEMARRAVETAVAGENPHIEVLALRALGDTLGNLPGHEAEADALLDRCSSLAEKIGRPMERGHCLWTRAGRLAETDPVEARRLSERAIEVALSADNPEGLIRALSQRMRIAWKTEPREDAIESSLRTLSAIEALRSLQEEAGTRAHLLSAWADDYYRLSGNLIEASDLESAFSVVERLRSRALLESLLLEGASVPHPYGDARHQLLEAIVAIQKRLLATTVSTEERERLLKELERLELEEQATRRTPEVSGVSFATLEEVRAELAPEEALLSYQVGLWKDLYGDFGGGAFVLVVTRERAGIVRLPDRAALKPAVEFFGGALERRDDSERPVGTRLFEDLMRAALASLPAGIGRLVLVPDGVLHELPFDALRESSAGEPLGARFELEAVPSATLWLRWRRERFAASPSPALAIADPALPAASESPSAERSAVLSRGLELGPLPHARREGRSLVRRLGRGSELRIGEDASEAFVKSANLRQYGVVHFAAHAIADDAYPERSAVILSSGSETEDGLLQPREIAELDLKGRVVVLSACRTASGSLLSGEGVLSISRAFFQAGARAVIGSRWPLRDDEAAVLFDSFYRELRTGSSVAAASKAAKVAAIDAGVPAMGWSSLVLLGDGSTTPFPGGLPPAGLESRHWVILLLLFSAGAILALRRRAGGSSRDARVAANRDGALR
jgi:tetratricopeptide (TPR) repeat protein